MEVDILFSQPEVLIQEKLTFYRILKLTNIYSPLYVYESRLPLFLYQEFLKGTFT